MSGRAKMGELKRAAALLGVTSTTLRQHGFKTASPARVQALLADPPQWLDVARTVRQKKLDKAERLSATHRTAQKLGIQVRAVKERNIQSADVADPPEWLPIERERRTAQIDRDRSDAEQRAAKESMQAEILDAYWRALKDGGDTDTWAAGVLHRAGIHTVEQDGQSLPVLPPTLMVVRNG